MKYVLRPGIIRVKVCGVFLLVPNRAASESCPQIRRIGLLGSALIDKLESDESLDTLYEAYRIIKKTSAEEARKAVDDLLASLVDAGYLIAAEVEG